MEQRVERCRFLVKGETWEDEEYWDECGFKRGSVGVDTGMEVWEMRCSRCFGCEGVEVLGVWRGLRWSTVDGSTEFFQPKQAAHAMINESMQSQNKTQT